MRLGTAAVPRVLVELAPGHRYRFRVRAADRVGNRSDWRYGLPFRLRAYQDTSPRVHYGRGWHTEADPSYAAGTTHVATRAGARATLSFTGREIALAAPTGPTRGRARVVIDGRFAGSFSLRAAVDGPSAVIARWSWATSARRTITIRVVGTPGHPRIDLDEFIVIR